MKTLLLALLAVIMVPVITLADPLKTLQTQNVGTDLVVRMNANEGIGWVTLPEHQSGLLLRQETLNAKVLLALQDVCLGYPSTQTIPVLDENNHKRAAMLFTFSWTASGKEFAYQPPVKRSDSIVPGDGGVLFCPIMRPASLIKNYIKLGLPENWQVLHAGNGVTQTLREAIRDKSIKSGDKLAIPLANSTK